VCSTTQDVDYHGTDEESDPTFQLVASYMRTVRSRPELASHIRYMDMPFHGVFTFPLIDDPDDEVEVPVHPNDTFSFYRLLLKHATNTEAIHIIYHQDHGDIIERCIGPDFTFDALTRLQLVFCPGELPCLYAILGAAPNLKTLYLLVGHSSGIDHMEPLPRVANLHIYQRAPASPNVLALLNACESLETFHLDLIPRPSLGREPIDAYAYEVYSRLHAGILHILSRLRKRHGKTLKSVRVNSPHINMRTLDIEGKTMFRQNVFSAFPNLESLFLDTGIYFRTVESFATSDTFLVDLLPPSIRRLHLLRWDLNEPDPCRVRSAVYSRSFAAAVKSGWFPHLREIAMDFKNEELAKVGDVNNKDGNGTDEQGSGAERSGLFETLTAMWKPDEGGGDRSPRVTLLTATSKDSFYDWEIEQRSRGLPSASIY